MSFKNKKKLFKKDKRVALAAKRFGCVVDFGTIENQRARSDVKALFATRQKKDGSAVCVGPEANEQAHAAVGSVYMFFAYAIPIYLNARESEVGFVRQNKLFHQAKNVWIFSRDRCAKDGAVSLYASEHALPCILLSRASCFLRVIRTLSFAAKHGR